MTGLNLVVDYGHHQLKKNFSVDTNVIGTKAADLMNKIDDIETVVNSEQKFSSAEKLKNKIKSMRAAAIESGGEFSTENLVFKVLRNNGYLEKLNDVKTKSFDSQMSLN